MIVCRYWRDERKYGYVLKLIAWTSRQRIVVCLPPYFLFLHAAWMSQCNYHMSVIPMPLGWIFSSLKVGIRLFLVRLRQYTVSPHSDTVDLYSCARISGSFIDKAAWPAGNWCKEVLSSTLLMKLPRHRLIAIKTRCRYKYHHYDHHPINPSLFHFFVQA